MSEVREDAEEKAIRLGLDLIKPSPSEVFVDLDSYADHQVFEHRFAMLLKLWPTATTRFTDSPSGKPWRKHAYVTVPELSPLGEHERIALQAALNSDPFREMLAIFHGAGRLQAHVGFLREKECRHGGCCPGRAGNTRGRDRRIHNDGCVLLTKHSTWSWRYERGNDMSDEYIKRVMGMMERAMNEACGEKVMGIPAVANNPLCNRRFRPYSDVESDYAVLELVREQWKHAEAKANERNDKIYWFARNLRYLWKQRENFAIDIANGGELPLAYRPGDYAKAALAVIYEAEAKAASDVTGG